MDESNLYAQRYRQSDYYWGKAPSQSCLYLLTRIKSDPKHPLRLLDIGCGEGRNAVHFAKNGFLVTGLDSAEEGLDKTHRLAQENAVAVTLIRADIRTWVPSRTYDVLFSSGTLHYLPPEIRPSKFREYREATASGGCHAFSVFVDKPFIPRSPDADAAAFSFRSGELMGYYWDWELLHAGEEIFDCMSGGSPHRHAVNRIIARWPATA